jgi:hypothetical protein
MTMAGYINKQDTSKLDPLLGAPTALARRKLAFAQVFSERDGSDPPTQLVRKRNEFGRAGT